MPGHVATGGRDLAMARLLASFALLALAALGACGGASFAESFPSPRRTPRAEVTPGRPPPAQVPAPYAAAPSGPIYYAPPAYSGSAPPPAPSEAPVDSPPTTWDRPIPEPPEEPGPERRCENTCDLANDGECDDGRSGAGSDLCMPGTDCADCGG
jgi:hypothetical protein